MIVSIIAAMAEGNRGIGLRGGLPWRLPADMARFRALTMGHSLIMGRTTWTPIAQRGLPGRRVIVLSRSANPQDSQAVVVSSLSRALRLAVGEEVFIGGGAQIYALALEANLVDRMYLTIVHGDLRADTFFPEYDLDRWETTSSEQAPADNDNAYPLTFEVLERIA